MKITVNILSKNTSESRILLSHIFTHLFNVGLNGRQLRFSYVRLCLVRCDVSFGRRI